MDCDDARVYKIKKLHKEIIRYVQFFCLYLVGTTGLEPATSWSQTTRSKPTELHPDLFRNERMILYRINLSNSMHVSLLNSTPEREFGGYIAGIDEVGRGCIAGPVVAACVIFSWEDISLLRDMDDRVRIRDSKKMTRIQRKLANTLIRDLAVYVGVGVIHSDVIDEINILQATFLAMKQASEGVFQVPALQNSSDMLMLVDGNMLVPGVSWNQRAIIGGDARVFSIAAASIIAKEYRDSFMEEVHDMHPAYAFASHKGYGTQAHYAAIQEHGMLPLHRKTFLKRFNDA